MKEEDVLFIQSAIDEAIGRVGYASELGKRLHKSSKLLSQFLGEQKTVKKGASE